MAVPDVEAAWAPHRRRVLDVAYRLLGSLTEADDIAQEVWLRLTRTDRAEIHDIEGWLVTATARLCLDHLRSARVARTTYVGPWLPEPLLAADDQDPADRVTLDESVRMALMVVLERLSPAQRTAYVLHDVFGVPYEEVAEIVGRSVAACRQLASRARRSIHAQQRFPVDEAQLRDTVEAFRQACEAGSVEALAAVLDSSATGWFDSGGLFPGAPTNTVQGSEAIATRLLESVRSRPVAWEVGEVNGEPGVLLTLAGRVVTAIALDVSGGFVTCIHAVGNPAKLGQRRRAPDAASGSPLALLALLVTAHA